MARSKKESVAGLIERYRSVTNRDVAFDALAAQRLGVGATDLHCLNIIESRSGLTAGELAIESGLTTGAVTGVVDRLQKGGLARRVKDEHDRRKVLVEVTPRFREQAGEVWGPVAADWVSTLARRFTAGELETIARFLEALDELGVRHLERLGGVPERPPLRHSSR